MRKPGTHKREQRRGKILNSNVDGLGRRSQPRVNTERRHYLGGSKDIEARFQEHAAGTGAKLLAAAIERGIGFEIVRVWECKPRDIWTIEKKLKAQKNGPKFCPACQGH